MTGKHEDDPKGAKQALIDDYEDKIEKLEDKKDKQSYEEKSLENWKDKLKKLKKSELKEFIKSTLNEEDKPHISKEEASMLKKGDKIKYYGPKGKTNDEVVFYKKGYVSLKSGGTIPYQSIVNEKVDINESVNDKTLNKIFKFFSRDLYGEIKPDRDWETYPFL